MTSLQNLLKRINDAADARVDEVFAQVVSKLTRIHARGVKDCSCEYCLALRDYIDAKIKRHRVYKYQRDYAAPNFQTMMRIDLEIEELRKKKNNLI